MLLPYNVDRPARRVPSVTYALMAANILVYLLTIGYSNLKMYADRPAYDQQVSQIEQLFKNYGVNPGSAFSSDGTGASGAGTSGWGGSRLQQGLPPGVDTRDYDGTPESARRITERVRRNFESEFTRILPPSQRKQFTWSRQHRRDALVLEQHPQVMEWLAYTPGRPSLWTLFSAMFLHADLDHIAGNMLFLWVFGRAVEDTLGRGIYLGAYFTCGFAATLLYHVMTRAFSPAGLLIPSLGASGAISGMQGLFAPRFYNTPVRVFYTTWRGLPIFYIGLPLLGSLLGIVLAGGFGLGAPGFTLATMILLAGFVIWGNETLWDEWKVKAAWLIACWVGFFDVIPLVAQALVGGEGGGVAHWAHIGGLLCGVLYAFLIGAPREGKSEYLVDSARQSLDMSLDGNALEAAQQVVMMKPDEPIGYQLLAEAYDRKHNRDEALKNYRIALDKYLKRGERSAASKLYQAALPGHTAWVPEAPVLFALGTQMAKDGDWKVAAESQAKLPYYHPEATEGEMAFIRAAQIYLEKLDNPTVAMQLIHEFGSRYPQSQWMEQATKLYQAASAKHSGAAA